MSNASNSSASTGPTSANSANASSPTPGNATPPPAEAPKKPTSSSTTSLIRNPHGYFRGVIHHICPPITTSSFQFNTLILIEHATKPVLRI